MFFRKEGPFEQKRVLGLSEFFLVFFNPVYSCEKSCFRPFCFRSLPVCLGIVPAGSDYRIQRHVSDDTVVGILPVHSDVHECDTSTNTLVSAGDDKLHSSDDRR